MGPLASLENILPLNYIPSAILQLCFYIESRFFPIQYFVTTALPPHFFLDSLHLPSHPKVYFIFIHMYVRTACVCSHLQLPVEAKREIKSPRASVLRGMSYCSG